MKLFGEELKKALLEDLERVRDIVKRRQENICAGYMDTSDCFISQAVNDNQIERIKMQLEILEDDGLMEIDVLVTDTEVIEPRWVETVYGSRIVANGVFAHSLAALVKKTGLKLEKRLVPCWVNRENCYVRWHTNMVTGEHYGFDRFVE